MSNENPPDHSQVHNQAVTSVGNCWVINRSRSHPGRIYYFNTLTGEAAWNLSDAEIEKAKQATKLLKPESSLEHCPEPTEPPVDQTNHAKLTQNHHEKSSKVPPSIYNKPVINNQFNKPPPHIITPIINSQCTKCSTVTQVDSSSALKVSPTTANSNIWTLPSSHQIVIAQTQTPQLNQPQPTVNVAYNNMDQYMSMGNTMVPFLGHFNNVGGYRFNNRKFQFNHNFGSKFNQRGNRRNFIPRQNNLTYSKNFNNSSTSNDLRQILSNKINGGWNKAQQAIYGDIVNDYINSEKNNAQCRDNNMIKIIKPAFNKKYTNDTDDAWIKKHASVQGTQLKLNVDPLRRIVFTGKSSCWFIVADVDVLLIHYNFINIVVNSDEDCQLMVSDQTMANIQDASRSNDLQTMHRAHYTLRLLMQQFASGHAVIGKDPSNDAQSTNILEFSVKLSGQNYDVVLVSDNIKWYDRKIPVIPIFNIQHLKEIIENKQTVSLERVQESASFNKNGAYQITISNDINNDPSTQTNSNRDIANENLQASFIVTEESCRKDLNKNYEETKKDKENSDNFKNIVDAKAQAQIDFAKTQELSQNSLNNHSTFKLTNTSTSSVNLNTNEIPKKREIRLKRNTSHQSNHTIENCEGRKQFKWHRRKISLSANDSVQQQPTSNIDTSKDQSMLVSIVDENFNTGKESLGNGEIKKCGSYLDIINRSDITSSSCSMQRVHESLTIDERSTSGIISNTASHVDSNSVSSLKEYNKNIRNDIFTSKCVMFEIESKTMEECLRVKCDEWVSRFVQIMEEILTDILQQSPSYLNRSMPPPWTLHEAAECIKKKFSDDQDVVEACIKLTSFLYTISDLRGKINTYINPEDFMEMYSYGVYLIDSLETILNDSEDVQAAADMLAKLLNDIKETNLDSGNNDLFDVIEDPSANVTMSSCYDSEHKESTAPAASEKTSRENTIENSKVGHKCNLRFKSGKKSTENKEKPQSVTFVRKIDIKSDFITSLHQKKLNIHARKNIDKSKSVKTNLNENSVKDKSLSPKTTSNEIKSRENNKSSPVANEPKIIRKFSKCLQFEEKLKSKQRQVLDMEVLDYSEEEEDYDSVYDDYYSDEETGEMFASESAKTNTEVGNDLDDDMDDNSNFNHQWIVTKIMKAIQEAFTQVHTFCEKIREEINVSETLSSERKAQIKDKAGKARQHVDNLCYSLNSILYREDHKSSGDVESALKDSGVHLDASMLLEYRNIIAKCSDQVNSILDSVDVLVETVK